MTETMNDKLSRWLKGNELAVDFALQVWDAAQKWDDVYDDRDELPPQEADDLLVWLAFGKEFSPFFAANADLLRPALLHMYLQWQAANAIEAKAPDAAGLAKSYMLRAGYYGFVHVMAWMAGGTQWARACAAEIYEAYGETPADIAKEFS